MGLLTEKLKSNFDKFIASWVVNPKLVNLALFSIALNFVLDMADVVIVGSVVWNVISALGWILCALPALSFTTKLPDGLSG